ncbi:hypothetical protein MMC30_008560 [Trapelia coarctata]|nr:hypothetical protein [Trapelia coarctata]
MESSQDEKLRQDEALERLVHGFGALLQKVEDLALKNAEFEQQIKALQAENRLEAPYGPGDDGIVTRTCHAISECGELKGHLSNGPDSTTRFLEDRDISEPRVNILEQDEVVNAGIAAWKSLKVAGNRLTLKGTKVPTLSLSPNANQTTPGSISTTPNPSSKEQDFTTQGTKGDLRCPFASEKFRRRPGTAAVSPGQTLQIRPDALPTPPGLRGFPSQDPIAAEFHTTDFVSPPPSVTGSASKCPIRFLDQHSPEEVAKYFENHKHEIPRSHEICVKRYQSNEQSIRQLDAKYGNLVSMIQGLGMKHQPMLVTKEEDEEETSIIVEQESMDKVAKWATTCSENVEDMPEGAPDDLSDTRTSNFDRPLKEIRVGESPSRPWGIQVPYTEGLALSNNSEEGIETGPEPLSGHSQAYERQPSEVPQVLETKPSRCPFGHGITKPPSQAGTLKQSPPLDDGVASRSSEKHGILAQEPSSKAKTDRVRRQEQPRMVFTGPVFIGYTPEQASSLMQTYQSSR